MIYKETEKSNYFPKVSIVINCFNGEKFLKESIESVLSQSYKNWELIFFDNGSTDLSYEIFSSFKDSRLNYFFSKEKTTLAIARNCAVQKCQGELIAFLDVDDYWKQEKLEIQVKEFNNKEVGLCCSGYYLINERKKEPIKKEVSFKDKIFNQDSTNDLLKDYFIHISTLVFRKEILVNLDYFFDTRFSIIEDFDFAVRLSLFTEMRVIKKPLAIYRWHSLNTGFVSDYQLGEEYNLWINDAANIKLFSEFSGFKELKKKASWFFVVRQMFLGNKKEVLKSFFKFGTLRKLKILLSLIVPTTILKKIVLRP